VGQCLFANASFESVLGLSRRSVLRGSMFDWFVVRIACAITVLAVRRNDYSTTGLSAALRPGALHGEPLPT